ncbi:MAG: hypothetical protein ACO1O6_13885 [Bacteroidota bacterium]
MDRIKEFRIEFTKILPKDSFISDRRKLLFKNGSAEFMGENVNGGIELYSIIAFK